MSDAPQSSANNQQQKVLQQILLQYAAQQQQQQQTRGAAQNIVLSVPVGTGPRTLPRLSLSPSAAVSPGVAIMSGSTSPLALQAQAIAGRLSQQQSQSFVQVSPSAIRGSQSTRVAVTSPQIIQGIPGASTPSVYMVPGGQRTLQLPAGTTLVHSHARGAQAVTATTVGTSQSTVQTLTSPRKHPLGKVDHSNKSPAAKGHMLSPKASKVAARTTTPSHSIVTKVVKKPETMQKPPPPPPQPVVDISQLSQEQIVEMRAAILKQRRSILRELNVAYIERLTESFFLQRGGNMMDYLAWKKRVPNTTLNAYLTKHKLEEKTARYSASTESTRTSAFSPTRRKSDTESRIGNGATDVSRKRTHHKAGLDAFDFNDDVEGSPPPVKVPSGFTIPTAGLSQGQSNQLKVHTGARPKDPKSPTQGAGASPSRRFLTPGAVPKQSKSPLSPGARDRLPTRQQSLSAVYDYSIGSQEMIVERAKQEAQVMQRIAELRKEGLWSAKRLPKVQEPPRYKSHWDYLLDEMQWLATDFSQERRWKKAAAKKLARAVAAYHREKQAKEIKAERDEANKLRKIASNIAKEVRQFWGNIEKVVQYKQQSRLDEKRKRALDMQLDFIVGQTEKYSSWLTEGLNLSEKGSIQGSTPASTQGSLAPSPDVSDAEQNDDEFRPVGVDSDDDEETIDVEERAAERDDDDDEANELELLQRESEAPIEEILSKLPQQPQDDDESEEKEADLKSVLSEPAEPKEEGTSTEDEEFVADGAGDEVVDDEDTIAKEEEMAGEGDHQGELDDLQAEGEMSMEELLAKYAGAYEEGFEVPQSPEESEMDSDDESIEDESSEEDDDEEAGDDDDDGELKDVGMEYLLHPEKERDTKESKKAEDGEAGPNQEITDIAKAAESLQPKGYTLSDTQVTTKVPSLLKHTLREYQHIGLDWLVTMNDKKLNGILADEMGLGKTIQTIALLAHLACEKSNWGPHLIVVPTSVMLNWEMEFKKWCPGFKILTYFGSQKERKQKRMGWTKQNAFHICITSYKLVIQDHVSFRRKKWKYLVLDEAQNIKNFKSQRWQTLLNFNSQRRLLLTGTPLQNNLMELWSLMHFLMPHVFQSHREFREWFSNPMSGMIEGSQEYNEGLIKRLHKVLRPFLLRRLKSQVEKQLPQKYEHVVRCRLSKRQRFLYDDFMGRTKTKETLKTGQFLSVINVLMQLRKVCNHPDLFELRPSISPFVMEGLDYHTASEVTKALDYHPLKHVNLANFNLCLADLELTLPAYIAHRTRQLQTPRRLIEEIDAVPEPPPRPPRMKMKPGKLLTPPGVAHVQREKLPMGRSSPSQQHTPGRASPLRAASPIRSVLRAASPLMHQGRASPGATQVILRSPAGTPVPRQTSILPHGYLASGASQHTLIPTIGGGTFALVSNPNNPGTFTIVQQHAGVPSATPLQQLPGYMATSMGPLAQQRLLQQQHQQLLNQGLQQMRQQQLLGGRTMPSYQLQQNQVGHLRSSSPIAQLGQISRGGVIQLIRPTVPLVNSTPLSPPPSVVVPAPQSPQLRSPIQPLVQVLQQQQVAQNLATPPIIHTTPVRPQNIVQAASVGPRMVSPQVNRTPPMAHQRTTPVVNQSPPVVNQTSPVVNQRTPPPAHPQTPTSTPQRAPVVPQQRTPTSTLHRAPSVHQRAPTVAQQLMQRSLQNSQGARPVGTVAPIQISATKPQTTVPSSTTTVVSSTPTAQRTTAVVASVAAVKSSPLSTPSKGAKADTKPDATRKLTASGGGGAGPPIMSTKRPVVRMKLLQKADLDRLKSGQLYQKEAAEAERKLRDAKKNSVFYMESLEQKLTRDHKDTLRRVARVNFRRCCAKPIYGEDLYSVVSITSTSRPATKGNCFSVGAGLVHCHCCLNGTGSVRLDAAFDHTTHLQRLLHRPTDYLTELKEIIHRYAFVIPKVTSPGFTLSTSHPSPAAMSDQKSFRASLSDQLHQRLGILHPLESRMKIQFPELRLIQYDCGKLQAMDQLLRQLKAGGHRVLIFTQMAKMLDVLERFLNFHGHIYLRLDGATKIESRQILMERFNADKRIFCFILSTRSGGVGVNLTGADTVIFYDSDWNPTMDAQAQDRCHRIGQTRDVHIYRLISEMTIEENIIKKANQKRLLADVSIDGGNFTTAFFRKTAITDLFEMDAEESTTPVKDPIKAIAPAVVSESKPASPAGISQKDLEQALAKAEDESDVRAATMAHAERDAELAEFDESIPYEGEDASKKEGEEGSKVEMELAQLDSQLTPIEKYAVKYMENTLEPINTEQLKEAEEMIEEAKKEWELGCLQVMTREAEEKAEIEEDDIFFTYDREDATNKVHNRRGSKQGRRRARPARRSNSRGNVKGAAASPSEREARYRNRSGAASPSEGSQMESRYRSRSGPSSPSEGPRLETRYRSRSGASSPSEGPRSPEQNRRSPRIRSPNHVVVSDDNKETQENHVGNTVVDGSPRIGVTDEVVEGLDSGLIDGAAMSTRSRSRSGSSTNSSSQGLGSPSGPLSPSTKSWIITTRAQKKHQVDDGHSGETKGSLVDGSGQPLSPDSGIRTRYKGALKQNDSGHPS